MDVNRFSRKASYPIDVTLLGIATDVSKLLLKPERCFTLSGISSETISLESKAPSSIDITPREMVIDVSLFSLKVSFLITVILPGITIDVNWPL